MKAITTFHHSHSNGGRCYRRGRSRREDIPLASKSLILLLFCCVIIIAGSCIVMVDAGNISQMLRPLSARQVYRLLNAVGRDDVVPEGRIVTHGLAAVTGWALGLTKALGGVFLYDIITANVTAEMLNEAENGGVTNVVAVNSVAAATASNGVRGTVQEVCFNTRQARSLEEADEVAAYYTRNGEVAVGNKKRRKSVVRKSVTPRRHKQRRRNKVRNKHRSGTRRVSNRIRNGALVGTTVGTATNSIGAPVHLGAETISGTGTLTTQPTTTDQQATTDTWAPTGTVGSFDTSFGTGRDEIDENLTTIGTMGTSASTTASEPDNEITEPKAENGLELAQAVPEVPLQDMQNQKTEVNGNRATQPQMAAEMNMKPGSSNNNNEIGTNDDVVDTSIPGTTSTITTETFPEGAISCVVLQRP